MIFQLKLDVGLSFQGLPSVPSAHSLVALTIQLVNCQAGP